MENRNHDILRILRIFSETALAINESETEEEITLLLENAVRQFISSAMIVITLNNEESNIVRIVRYSGFPLQSLTKAFQKLFGIDPLQMEVKMSEMDNQDLALFTSGKLEKLKDLETFTGHTVSSKICVTFEKLFRIKAIYSIGFIRNKKYKGSQTGDFGGLTLFLKKQETLEHPEMIEALVQEVSVAIQRRRAEVALLESQEEIKSLNKELEQKVIDRTLELENSNKALEAFSHCVSHDLRTPLRAISGFSTLLETEFSLQLGDKGNHLLQTIVENTKKMDHLITGLLAISKVSRSELKKSIINSNEMVESCIAEYVTPLDQQRITFTVEKLSDILGDPTLIRQVWVNLIENAVKYSQKKEKPVITMMSRIENDFTIFSIKDNGAGFNPEYKAKLFTIFQRLHNDDEFQGTGVGLAIVERIIRRHGGKVWAEGEEGQGATFYFSLPISA